MPTDPEPDGLTLPVIALERGAGEDEIREAGIPDALARVFRRRRVPVAQIKDGLRDVEAALDDVLQVFSLADRHGFQLSDVAVSLAVSVDGSIGVVSAGVEAGITVTFSRPEKDQADPEDAR